MNKIFDPVLYEKFNKQTFYTWIVLDEPFSFKPFADSVNYLIDYINKTGPYDGLLGFSVGSLLVRVLLKINEVKSPFPQLNHTPGFGIMASGPLPLNDHVNDLFLNFC
jgi:hypothetical protein